MKLINQIFRTVGNDIKVNYKMYGKHRVNIHGECEHQKRIDEAKKKALKEYQERVGCDV